MEVTALGKYSLNLSQWSGEASSQALYQLLTSLLTKVDTIAKPCQTHTVVMYDIINIVFSAAIDTGTHERLEVCSKEGLH